MLYVKLLNVKHKVVAYDDNDKLIIMDDEELTRDELLAVNWSRWMEIPTAPLEVEVDECGDCEEYITVEYEDN